jgi:quercetin dioxygenase-like cupin family protein
MEPEAGIVLGAGDGERVGTSVLKATRPELSFLELQVQPGGSVSPHFHKGHSDSFYVLEGDVEFHLGDEVVQGTPGTYVLAPPRVVHWFRNVTAEPARVLNLHTPGGFADYMRERAGLTAEGLEPDAAFFERHDIFDV